MTVDELNALPDPTARAALRACCGARLWIDRMVSERPFAGRAAAVAAAHAAGRALTDEEWRAAIAHHPRIGESRSAAATSARAAGWSAEEQSGARGADAATRAALVRGNASYEHRFGHPFVICATGKSAKEMLAALESRLSNDAVTELAITADELRKITMLRLEKLLPSA